MITIRAWLEHVGYWARPYDLLADRRRWRWQPRARCGLPPMPADDRDALIAAVDRLDRAEHTKRVEAVPGRLLEAIGNAMYGPAWMSLSNDDLAAVHGLADGVIAWLRANPMPRLRIPPIPPINIPPMPPLDLR